MIILRKPPFHLFLEFPIIIFNLTNSMEAFIVCCFLSAARVQANICCPPQSWLLNSRWWPTWGHHKVLVLKAFVVFSSYRKQLFSSTKQIALAFSTFFCTALPFFIMCRAVKSRKRKYMLSWRKRRGKSFSCGFLYPPDINLACDKNYFVRFLWSSIRKKEKKKKKKYSFCQCCWVQFMVNPWYYIYKYILYT